MEPFLIIVILYFHLTWSIHATLLKIQLLLWITLMQCEFYARRGYEFSRSIWEYVFGILSLHFYPYCKTALSYVLHSLGKGFAFLEDHKPTQFLIL